MGTIGPGEECDKKTIGRVPNAKQIGDPSRRWDSQAVLVLHKSMLTAVSGLGNGSVWPSEYFSGKTGADFSVARMLKVLGFSFGAALRSYKQAKAKLDGYGSL